MGSPPNGAGLLNRIAQHLLLPLVGELADAISAHEIALDDTTHQRLVAAWNPLLPAIAKARKSLPPDPDPVANWLCEVDRVAEWFNGVVREHGLLAVLFRFDCDDFRRLADEGRRLFPKTAAQCDAFVDAPAAVRPTAYFPMRTPRPPNSELDAAIRNIPTVLANVAPDPSGAIEIRHAALVRRLQEGFGHTLAAAHWAVYALTRVGALQPCRIEVRYPLGGREVGGRMPWWGGLDDRRMEWRAGGPVLTEVGVKATESLWAGWRSLADEIARQAQPAGGREPIDKPAESDLPAGATGDQPAGSTKDVRPKKSTVKGEAREKLIAALTLHHQYADGGCLNEEPIGNNELARKAGVDRATASAFFKQEFESHGKYKVACRSETKLVASLKLLNGDFSPHQLYGGKPAGEDRRDDE